MPNNPNLLAELIDDARARNGWSLEDVVARAKAHGHSLSKGNLNRIRQDPIKQLSPETLRAVADGVAIPIRTVVHAALQTVGLPSFDDVSTAPESAIETDPSLTSQQRRMLLAAIKEARQLNKEDARSNKPVDLSSRRKGPGLGQPPADVAARPVTDPSQLVDPNE